ncbi:MAG: cytochrome c maturation protein CcmE [Bacillota bacterium]
MNSRKNIIIIFSIMIIFFVFLVYINFEKSVSYYYTLPEVIALEDSKHSSMKNSNIRIKGQLERESIEYNRENKRLKFVLKEDDALLQVEYEGDKPDYFSHSREIIIEGKLKDNRRFEADKIMSTCPSQYEEKDN